MDSLDNKFEDRLSDLNADISTLRETNDKFLQTYHSDFLSSDDDEDDKDLETFIQNHSPERSSTLLDSGNTQSTNSDSYTRTSTDTVLPATPENHLTTVTKSSSFRSIDPFYHTHTKRKSPQHMSTTTARTGHRAVISDPNQESPKRFKTNSSTSTPNITMTLRSPQHNQPLEINNTPSPTQQNKHPRNQQQQQQQQQQQLDSSHRIDEHGDNNIYTYNTNRNIHGHSQHEQRPSHHYQTHPPHPLQSYTQHDQQQPSRDYQGHGFAVPEYAPIPETGGHMKLGERDYLVLNRIGSGASSQVYNAYSMRDERCYALKYIEVKGKRENLVNAKAEIDLLLSLSRVERVAGLRHYCALPRPPDALSKRESERLPTAVYLVMELGEIDLAHLIKRQSEKGLDFTFIRYFWEQMVRAVNDIHSMNVVHCDLKPANFVLIKGILKLIDFGISKTLPDDTTNIQKDSQIGTFNYMSPESLTDVAAANSQNILVKQGRPSDIWALGCILYMMVYGHTPFSKISMPQKMFYITQPAYAIRFDKDVGGIKIPDEIIIIMKGCLQRDKSLRPTIEELLRTPLF